tara:strand:+ start:1190 stop:1402 length:213 start_codon:yes stop_codon:yes gene_type:complete
MGKKQIKYAIYFNYQKACWGTAPRQFEAITNNPEKWLEEHNESRIAEGNEAEELWMFDIEEVGAEYIYKD